MRNNIFYISEKCVSHFARPAWTGPLMPGDTRTEKLRGLREVRPAPEPKRIGRPPVPADQRKPQEPYKKVPLSQDIGIKELIAKHMGGRPTNAPKNVGVAGPMDLQRQKIDTLKPAFKQAMLDIGRTPAPKVAAAPEKKQAVAKPTAQADSKKKTAAPKQESPKPTQAPAKMDEEAVYKQVKQIYGTLASGANGGLVTIGEIYNKAKAAGVVSSLSELQSYLNKWNRNRLYLEVADNPSWEPGSREWGIPSNEGVYAYIKRFI